MHGFRKKKNTKKDNAKEAKGEMTVEKPRFITPERQRIAKVFKNYVEKAVDELGPGYTVDLQGNFYDTPIRITIEISRTNPMESF